MIQTLKTVCMYPLRRIKRTRVSRGFTVHSPFAYYFITKVLRERLPFYCFDTKVRTRRERRLFRLMNYFQPTTACILGSENAERAVEVMKMVCPRVEFVENPQIADFVFACPDVEDLPLHCRVLYAPHPSPETRRRLIEATEEGMTFANARAVIAVTRQGLPRQHYSLLF